MSELELQADAPRQSPRLDLEQLIAIEEIRDVKARYVRYADYKRWDLLAGLFLPDATFTGYKVDRSIWFRMSGREEIQHAIAGRVGPAQPIHHLFSAEIEITSPSTARSIWSMEDWIFRPDGGTMHGYGHYHGRYEKIDGIWFIAELEQTRLKLDFT
jgi:hypothetical protein